MLDEWKKKNGLRTNGEIGDGDGESGLAKGSRNRLLAFHVPFTVYSFHLPEISVGPIAKVILGLYLMSAFREARISA